MPRRPQRKHNDERPEIPRTPFGKPKRNVPLSSRQPMSIRAAGSADSSLYHPPSLIGSNVTTVIQRHPHDTTMSVTSFVRDSSEPIYHPPKNIDDNVPTDEQVQAHRYRAALEGSFTPKGVTKFSRNMDSHIIQLLSSDATESTTVNNTSSYTTTDSAGVTSTNTFATTPTHNDDEYHMTSGIAASSDFSHAALLKEDAEHVDYFRVKQAFGYCSIGITAIQLLVLMMQLALCGIAPLDVNPMIGPYPDAISEWGGKNTYYLLEKNQIFRYITPAILHVGIVHLLLNAYVQLETCAFFEREWGSIRWLALYMLSEVGCVSVSSVLNPDMIAVGSSGAIMGIIGAKFAQLLTYYNFELVGGKDATVRLEQLSGIMCSLSIIALLSFINYIDWSGHVGGFGTGFCAGIVAFAGPIRSNASKFLCIIVGLTLMGVGFYYTFETLYTKIVPDSDLADACEYFRNLYTEDYDCECVWG